MSNELSIVWCDNLSIVPTLTEFFIYNVTDKYISHGEIQSGRAETFSRWSLNLFEIMSGEIESIISNPLTTNGWQGIAIARESTTIIALALVRFENSRNKSYGIIDDLLVDSSHRSQGVGLQLLRWIEHEAMQRGIHYLFLESGIANDRAHAFFKAQGFQICSLTMVKHLTEKTGL
jgi:GNAT superfamily N-acetyltransferase